MDSLKYYQSDGYGKINGLIRDPDFNESLLTTDIDHEIIRHINNIDTQLKNNDLPNLYYRGISGTFIPQSIKLSSGIITNTAYTSTTDDKKIAQIYAENGCCILVFKIPSNLKTYQYTYDGYSEKEVLIERNTQFQIVKEIQKNLYMAELQKYTPPVKTQDLDLEKMLEQARQKQLEEVDWKQELDTTDEEYEDEG